MSEKYEPLKEEIKNEEEMTTKKEKTNKEMIAKMKDSSLLTEKESVYLHDKKNRMEKIASDLSPSDYLNIVQKRLSKEFF